MATESGSTALRIGDTVLFQVSSGKDRNGYMYYELSSAPYNFMTVFPLEHGSELEPKFPNIDFATFKVIAPNKYKAGQNLKVLEERRRKLTAAAGETFPSKSQSRKSADDYEQIQISQAKKLAKTEETENSQEQARRAGTKVVYGDLVQLQHVASGKFVNVRSEASKTESNNLLVNLSKDNSEGCIFKILPRYKVRSEGDEVRYNDQMKFESTKTQGQYFSCSSIHHTLSVGGFRAHPHFFELNLSATESSITLIPHFSPSAKHPDKVLKAGDCVRLFHREDECYVVAVGSFANQAQPISENVHCRLRRVDQRKHASPSSSANTYWQIEKEEDPRTGEVLYWEERCRIKHLPTRLYLAVCKSNEGEWKVTLKPRNFDESDLDTLFSFHALIEEGIEVLLDSYAQIKHLVSERWLHLEKNRYVRKNFDPTAKGLAGLQWDHAELFTLSTSASQGDYDSFTLQEVPFDLLQKFNYVAGVVPVLTSHIQAIDEGYTDLTDKQATHVIRTLAELGDWIMTLYDRDTKNNQKILRNLQVIEQLTEILKASKRLISTTEPNHHNDICRECYNVIQKFLEGDSRKNENYLARFLEFFQSQVHKGLNAEEVLVEIVQDNLAIVTKMAEERMEDMIKQFKDTRDARFLEFLSSLCVCSNRPIPSTQERLLNELVIKHGRDVLFRTEVRKKQNGSCDVVCYKPGSSQPIPLRSLKPDPSGEDQSDGDYELLKEQLHLFGKLCKGNNQKALDFLVIPRNKNGYVSFKEAHECARNAQIDPGLRKCYVELILVMFVDVDDNRPFLDHLCYSFVYSELSPTPYADTGDDDVTALTEVKNIYFPHLKDWFVDVIKDHVVLHGDEAHISENELFAQILNVLGNLIRNGYYDSEDDIDKLMDPLIKVLDGKTDIQDSTEKKKDSKENRAVFEVKIKAIEVLELFFRFKFYVKLQKFIHDFKALDGGGDGSRGGAAASRRSKSGAGPPNILKRLRVNIDPTRSHDFLHSMEMARTIRNRLTFLCKGTPKGTFRNGILESVLLDLSEYDCDELVTASLDLLTQMYFFEEELFNKAHQSQILTCNESIRHYERVKTLLPKLRHLLRIDPDPRDQEKMKVILDELSCLMVVTPETNEPNVHNQIMLNNFGILDDILSYILSKGSGNSSTLLVESSTETGLGVGAKTTGAETGESLDKKLQLQQEVLQKCFCFLRFLTTDYKDVQDRLFTRIDDLLSVRIPTPVLADLADLLTEVFTGGADIVLKVTESHVEKIFSIIVNSGNAMVQAQFMVTLEAMMKIEELNVSVKSMQAAVIKNFCRFREKFCHKILGEDGKFDSVRMEILTKVHKDTTPPDPQLQLLLSVTDMLAACAEGKQLFIESVCQNIFSLDELISIVSNPLPPLRKRPFVRFLLSVYMTSDRDDEIGSNRIGGSTLSHGIEIWTYLEHLGELLKDTAKALQEFEEKKNMRHRLQTTRKGRPLSQMVLPPIQRALPGVTDDKGVLLPGLLEYIIEGVLPFLHNYYLSYFNPNQVSSQQQKEKEYLPSVAIARNMMMLRKELLKVCTSQDKIDMFRDIILTLHRNERIRTEANIDSKVESASMASGGGRQQVTSSSKRGRVQSRVDQPQSIKNQMLAEEKEVLRTINDEGLKELKDNSLLMKYKEQEKLNATFKVYTRNYQLAYVGSNTATDQIGSPVSDMPYNEPGEELPLGPNFQHLVHLYRGSGEVRVKKQAEMLLKQLEISSSRTDQIGERQQVVQDVLDVRCLQILRALIHNQIMMIDPELKDRDPILYRSKSDDLVVPVQNAIQKFCGNAIQKVILLLAHPNENISREAIALMKTMLFTGNEDVQEGLAKSVQETREETLFVILRKRLEIASIKLKETRDLQLLLESDYAHGETNTEKPARVQKQISINIEEEPAVRYAPNTSSEEVKIEESTPSPSRKEQSVILPSAVVGDTTWTNLVLEVIRFMCDGQNRTLQHYLREQPDNFKTVNVVAEVTTLLHTYTADFNRDDLDEIGQIVQALIEMCVGNVLNQRVIFDKLVNEPLNRLLSEEIRDTHADCDDTDKCPQCRYLMDLVQVKGSCIELIDAMLENTSEQTKEIALGIGSTIEIESVLDTMRLFHQLQTHPLMILNEMNDDCQRGMFRCYHVIMALMEHKAISGVNDKNDLKNLCDPKTKEALNECSRYSKTIEIHFEGEEGSKPTLARVHFPHNPFNKLREPITEKVRWNIDRDSMEDKQRSLTDLMPALKSDIKHQEKLRGLKVLMPFLVFHTYRYRALMLLTLIINLFVLFLYEAPPGATGVFRPNLPTWFGSILLYILGAVHLIMSIWVFVEYFIINWPHFRLPSFCYTLWEAFVTKVLHRKWKATPPSTCLDVGIIGVKTLYMFIFLCSSGLSLGFSGYFYCICLLFVIADNDILQRVLRAVTKNGISLIWVGILGVIMLFIYAVISFAFLHNYFGITNDASLYCTTLLQCMYTVLRYGLIDNIGLLVPFNSTAPDGDTPGFAASLHLPRLIFDLSFFIIIITIGLNIVFGIIVDTFSELREERCEIEKEQKNQCFICDLPSHLFERKAKGFNVHVKHDHNMWDYVYYSLYLDSIDTGDHNAIQKYVYELIQNKDTSFFPQQEATCLPDEDDTTGQMIEALMERVDYVVHHFKTKEQVKSVSEKKQKQKNWEEKVLLKSQSQDK